MRLAFLMPWIFANLALLIYLVWPQFRLCSRSIICIIYITTLVWTLLEGIQQGDSAILLPIVHLRRDRDQRWLLFARYTIRVPPPPPPSTMSRDTTTLRLVKATSAVFFATFAMFPIGALESLPLSCNRIDCGVHIAAGCQLEEAILFHKSNTIWFTRSVCSAR